jgi:hypothetical protein
MTRAAPALMALLLPAAAAAQIPQPRLDAVLPPAARAGTTVDARIVGGALDDADKLIFSHPGITAAPVMTTPDRFIPEPRLVKNQFKISVAADVPAGVYEVRAAGFLGLSNARRFVVGEGEEIFEKEPNNDLKAAAELAVGAAVSGTCDPQNYDTFKIAVQKGRRILIDCWALRIDSRALPVLTLLDESGRRLRESVGSKFRDPRLDFTPAVDGVVFVRLCDVGFAGGDTTFYRLTVGASPWIEFADPVVLRGGADNAVTLYGLNLPGSAPSDVVGADGLALEKLAVTIAAPADAVELPTDGFARPGAAAADLWSWRLKGSNPVRFMIADVAPTAEVEPNDAPESPQALTPPVEIAGRFGGPADRDGFAFDAKKGDRLWIEIFSRRFGLPTDPILVIQQIVKNEKGETSLKELATAEEQPFPLPGLPTDAHNRIRLSLEDPAVLWTAPEDGRFRVLVRDQAAGARPDPRTAYRLRIRPPRPDFRLVALPIEEYAPENKWGPWISVLRRGGSQRLLVAAYRREGFEGAIRIEAESPPPGLLARPTIITPERSATTLVLQAAPDAPAYAGPIRLVGRSDALARPVRSIELAGLVNDAGEPLLGTLTDRLCASVDANLTAPLTAQLGGETPSFRMSRGGKLKVPVTLVKNADFPEIEKVKVKLTAAGIPNPRDTKPIGATEVTLDTANAKAEMELDFTERAVAGSFSFHVAGEATVPYRRCPPRAARAAEDQKRIEEVAKQVAEEAKQAEAARAAAEQAAKQAGEVVPPAEQALAKAKEANNAEETAKAETALAEAKKKVEAAQKAHQDAVEAKKRADALVAAGEQAKKNAAEELKQANEANKEQKLKIWVASLPVVVEVVSFPVVVTVPAGGVTLKAGEKVEAPVQVARDFGFADAVTLELAPPQGVALKLAEACAIPKEAGEGKLAIAVDAAVAPGKYDVVVRASISFNGRALKHDVPLSVTVEAKAE